MKKKNLTLDAQGGLNRGKEETRKNWLVRKLCHTGHVGMLKAKELGETEEKPLSYYSFILFPP